MKFSKNIFSTFGLRWCIGCVALLLSVTGCKKAIDVGPPRASLAGDNVYTSNGSAESVLSGLLSNMAGNGTLYNGANSVSLLMGLYADELINYSTSSTNYIPFYTNTLSSQGKGTFFWSDIYIQLYTCNTAIQGLSNPAATLTPAIQKQLLGEFKFIRAFIYFYAVNLYGDVPMPLTSNYLVNNSLSRTPKAQVYQQIIQDLKDAQTLLSDGKYLTGTGAATTDRIHPNKQAASALLARVYLYLQDWQNAEAQATSVIGTSIYTLEPNLNQVFLKGTREAIWQIQPVNVGYNNADAYVLVVTTSPSQSIATQVPLNNILINTFEAGDNRFTNWVGKITVPAKGNTPTATYYYAYKYKVNSSELTPAPVTEYPVMLRLAEQYLIRAEARAQQGNTGGAQADLNAIRARAGLAATTAAGKDDLLAAIAHERQIELFTEMGNRWFDLKRTGKADAVMSVVLQQKSGGIWNSNKQLLPIPNSEILIDTKLTQNPGY